MLAIGISICANEASASLAFAFWAPFIISARDASFAWQKGPVPFGLIFAQFTCASALGSLGFIYLSSNGVDVGKKSSQFVQLCMATCSMCLLVTLMTEWEILRFWCLCFFQFFAGFCSSSMANLKENLMGEHQRAKMNGLVRTPLNMLVVGALVTVEDSMSPLIWIRDKKVK